MTLQTIRKLAHAHGRWLGTLLSLVALAAFLQAFTGHLRGNDLVALLGQHRDALLVALLIYLAAYVPMSLAWTLLARRCGAQALPGPLLRVFLVSQIGKYLPGNVGHLLGRAWMAQRIGVPVGTTAMALTLEMAGVLSAGALLAFATGLAAPATGDHLARYLPFVAAGLAAMLLAALLVLSRKRVTARAPAVGAFCLALVCYLLVFALLAAAHGVMLGMISGIWTASALIQLTAAVLFSWLVGFLVPGAPAGLGLREISLMALLAGVYPAATVAFAVAAMRLVTMTGDGIACLAGLVLIPGPAPQRAVA